MWSITNLNALDLKKRKIDDQPNNWHDEKLKLLKNINKYHFSPATFTYRNGNSITKGAIWILIDVDEEGSNVEKKLVAYKLEYIKAPSASADGTNVKEHYLVRTKRLSHNAAVARAQINEFYETLGLVNVDTSAIDPVRYFAPCGCAEKLYTKKWKKRVKWCNKRTIHVKGNKWIPSDDISPIYGSIGKQVSIKIETINWYPPTDDWEPSLNKKPNGNTDKIRWILEQDTPISLGRDGWTTAGLIAEKLNDGETVSNLIGCPGYNHKHSQHPSTVGYGYATRKGNFVFFSCGGNECKKQSYTLRSENGKI